MHAASRTSLAATREKVTELLRAQPGAAGTVADELLAVARVLVSEPRLRRLLSDFTAPAEARTGLVDSLFGGKVSDTTGEVLHALAEARWSNPTDLVDAAELLGVQAALAAAEAHGELATVEDELFRFGRVVSGDPELAATLGDSSALPERRESLAEDLLAGKAHRVTTTLAKLAVRGLGGRGFETGLDRLVELAAEARSRSVAHVTVAAPLTDEQERALAETLERTYGRPMSLQVEVDPELIGGARVRVGDDLYDGSVARRLAEARNALAKSR
jgi:F-type H+-transporting ATPase subunit delta